MTMKRLFIIVFFLNSFLSYGQVSIQGAKNVNTKVNNKATFERKELDFTKIKVENSSGGRVYNLNFDGVKIDDSAEAVKIVFDENTSKPSFNVSKTVEKQRIIIGLGNPTVTSPISEVVLSEPKIVEPKVADSPKVSEQPKIVEPKVADFPKIIEPPKETESKVEKPKSVEPKIVENTPEVALESVAEQPKTQKLFAIEEILIHDNMGLIFFDKYSLEYKSYYTQELQKISDYLLRNPKSKVAINSYVTFEAAKDNYKPILANTRALKIIEILTKTYGIDALKLEIVIIDKHQYDETLKGCITFTTLK